MAKQIRAFYVKCRPQNADAWEICREYRCVFVGYPPRREGPVWDRQNVHDSLFDISVPKHEWEPKQISPSKWRRMVSHNRVFALKVGKGSFAVIPRPGQGVCHIGKVSGPFELVSDPRWSEDYLSLREEQGLEVKNSHLGDIVQTWPIEDFRTVPFPLVPR